MDHCSFALQHAFLLGILDLCYKCIYNSLCKIIPMQFSFVQQINRLNMKYNLPESYQNRLILYILLLSLSSSSSLWDSRKGFAWISYIYLFISRREHSSSFKIERTKYVFLDHSYSSSSSSLLIANQTCSTAYEGPTIQKKQIKHI